MKGDKWQLECELYHCIFGCNKLKEISIRIIPGSFASSFDSILQAYPDVPQNIAATGHTAPHDSGLSTAHSPQVSDTPGHIFPTCLQENCLA